MIRALMWLVLAAVFVVPLAAAACIVAAWVYNLFHPGRRK